ncbi:MAG: protein translocase subunit SecD [Herbinix sp.]|nr:protein translocase subunit SecD [Herbinix sp.]
MKTKKTKPVFFIVLIIALLMAYTAMFGVNIPMGNSNLTILGSPDMRYGIDIRGGVNAAFQPVGLDRKPTLAELESARAIIETRLDQKSILDRDVTIDKENGYVIVNFPWKADEKNFNPESAIAELGQTAQLTFCNSDGEVLIEGSHVSKSSPALNKETGEYVVELTFDEKGTALLSKVTEQYLGKPMNIFMDETLIQTARISAHITGGTAEITGMDDYDEAKALSDKINSGALPFSMVTKNYSAISPTLGSGALSVMVLAGFIAFAIICVLLIAYYRLPGFVACISLLIQITGQLLSLSVPQMTLTLQGIAGIILSIGMGVDANVIASERISEEIKSGKSILSAITAGFKSSFSSIFDGNITVLIVAFIMMTMGTGALLSFGYTLFTGIVFNFIAGVTCSRLMIRSLSSFKFLQKPALYTCWSRRVSYEK